MSGGTSFTKVKSHLSLVKVKNSQQYLQLAYVKTTILISIKQKKLSVINVKSANVQTFQWGTTFTGILKKIHLSKEKLSFVNIEQFSIIPVKNVNGFKKQVRTTFKWRLEDLKHHHDIQCNPYCVLTHTALQSAISNGSADNTRRSVQQKRTRSLALSVEPRFSREKNPQAKQRQALSNAKYVKKRRIYVENAYRRDLHTRLVKEPIHRPIKQNYTRDLQKRPTEETSTKETHSREL